MKRLVAVIVAAAALGAAAAAARAIDANRLSYAAGTVAAADETARASAAAKGFVWGIAGLASLTAVFFGFRRGRTAGASDEGIAGRRS